MSSIDRVVIFGASGMLGHKLVQVLSQVFDVTAIVRRPELAGALAKLGAASVKTVGDVRDEAAWIAALESANPDAVLNACGLIKQKSGEGDPSQFISVNSLFPHRLAAWTMPRRMPLIHFSTDCVFSGNRGRYASSDTPDANDIYGRSKLLGEVCGDYCTTLRSSIVGLSLEGSASLLDWFVSNRQMTARGYTRAIFSGLTTLEMARLCRRLLEDPARPTGLWQVASEPIDKFSLLTLVNDALDLRIALTSDPHFFLDRSLDGAAFTERTGYRTPSWPNMVSAFAKDVEAHASLYRASLYRNITPPR